MKRKLLTIFSIGLASMASSQAAVIFSQNFNSSSTVSDYVSASSPNSGQFNAIGSSGGSTTFAITSGALTYTRTTANTGSFSRTTDFSPTPLALIYQLDLTVSGNTSAQTTAAVFQVGSGFGTANSAQAVADTYARFGINFGATNGQFGIRDIGASTSSSLFSGTQSIFWVLNNSGSSVNYTAPNSTTVALANDVADLWVGNTKVWDGVAITTASQSMTDLKFAYSAGSGTIAIDNMVITAIPEPGAALLGGMGILTLLRRRRF